MSDFHLQKRVRVIGGGLAGSEASLFLANNGYQVDLYEMRPEVQTEAHKTNNFAELVCSNSFKSLSLATAPGILKREMELMGSQAILAAKNAQVAAGEALAVDRDIFSREVTAKIENHPKIRVLREEVQSLWEHPSVDESTDCQSYAATIVASGPLTSPALSECLRQISGESEFYFYDAISPVVQADSIDYQIAFRGNRHGKPSRFPAPGSLDEGDYINCPMTKEEYLAFINALAAAEKIESKNFEQLKHFEGCMPIEEMLDRGQDTLRFGPMRPVGFTDPRTNRRPYALVQLRAENRELSAYNLVGFQTRMKYGAQKSVFRMIPGLENAEFYRLGSMHRNAFVNAPKVLADDLSLRSAPDVYLAGQITGVEGYMESAAIGLLVGRLVLAQLQGLPLAEALPPRASAFGALYSHLRNHESPDFQPTGINFGLFSDAAYSTVLAPLREQFAKKKKIPKLEKRAAIADWSIHEIEKYLGIARPEPVFTTRSESLDPIPDS